MDFLSRKTGLFKKHDRDKLNDLVSLIDPKTFFRVGIQIMQQGKPPRFHKNLPHLLGINDEDNVIKIGYIEELLNKNVKNVLLIKTKVSHYPKMDTKKYFDEKIDRKSFLAGISFLEKFDQIQNS